MNSRILTFCLYTYNTIIFWHEIILYTFTIQYSISIGRFTPMSYECDTFNFFLHFNHQAKEIKYQEIHKQICLLTREYHILVYLYNTYMIYRLRFSSLMYTFLTDIVSTTLTTKKGIFLLHGTFSTSRLTQGSMNHGIKSAAPCYC